MGTKNNPGVFDCYDSAGMDEPMFILIASDADAPELVEDWCRKRLAKLLASEMTPYELHRGVAKIAEALACANAMREYWSDMRTKHPAPMDMAQIRAIVHSHGGGWSTGLDGPGEKQSGEIKVRQMHDPIGGDPFPSKSWRGTGPGRGVDIDAVQRARGLERNPDYHGRFPPPGGEGRLPDGVDALKLSGAFERLDPEGGIPGRQL